MKIRIPMNFLSGGMVIKREAIIDVNEDLNRIGDGATVVDYRDSSQYPLSHDDAWALEAILERFHNGSQGIEAAISTLVQEIIEKEGNRIMIWPLYSRFNGSPILHEGKAVPDWLALDAYNAYMHGNPDMWNPYGRDQPADALVLSARDFVRTYKEDLGLEWLQKRGTLNEVLTKDEIKKLGKLKEVSRINLWKWDNLNRIPMSIRGLQALSEFGAVLPLRGTYPMFHSFLALAARVFFHGDLSNGRVPTITLMHWEKEKPIKNGESLSAVDYRLGYFTAYHTGDMSLTLNNPASAAIGRVLTLMGVPLGSEQKYDSDRMVLYPVSEAYKLLINGAKDNLLRKFVKEYVETYFLVRGGIEWHGNARFHVSFFGQRISLPQDYRGGNLEALVENEPENAGFQDHLRLIEFLFPDMAYTTQHSRRITTRNSYYLKMPRIYISDVGSLMDAMPKLKVHYDRQKMR